jgi:hypothetical protein
MAETQQKVKVKKESADGKEEREPSYTRDHPSRGPGEYKWGRMECRLIEIILKFVSDRAGYFSHGFTSSCAYL